MTAGLDHVAKVQRMLSLAQFLATRTPSGPKNVAGAHADSGAWPLTDPLPIHKLKDGSLCRARESVVTNPDK